MKLILGVIAFALIISMPLAAAHVPWIPGSIGGYAGEVESSTNCNGFNAYQANFQFQQAFSVHDSLYGTNSFSAQLNVLALQGNDYNLPSYWVQVTFQDVNNNVSPSIQVSINGQAVFLAASGPAFNHQFVKGDQIFLTVEAVGNQIIGAVIIENSASQTVYWTEMSYSPGFAANIITAYAGLYGAGGASMANFTYSGPYLATGYLLSSSWSGNIYQNYTGICLGQVNGSTGEASNLNYIDVTTTHNQISYELQ